MGRGGEAIWLFHIHKHICTGHTGSLFTAHSSLVFGCQFLPVKESVKNKLKRVDAVGTFWDWKTTWSFYSSSCKYRWTSRSLDMRTPWPNLVSYGVIGQQV